MSSTPASNKPSRKNQFKKKKSRRNRSNKSRSSNAPNYRKANKASAVLQNPPHYPSNLSKGQRVNKPMGLQEYLEQLPSKLVTALYKSTGGQPSRINNFERLVQLTAKALSHDTRLKSLVKDLKPNHLNTLVCLIQCGGIAHSSDIIDELIHSYGGRDKDWVSALDKLGKFGLLARSATEGDDFFYIIPEPLLPLLEHALRHDLTVPTFSHEGVELESDGKLATPFDFSLVALASYLHQKPVRLTQQHDIHKNDREELDAFFGQLWSSNSERFDFLLHFLLGHGMLSFQNMQLNIVSGVLDEWLSMSQSDRTGLVMAKLNEEFALAEWLLWVVHQGKGEWLPAHPLQSLYRRWIRGERWRQRFYGEDWSKENTDDIPSFATLLRYGFLERGVWGQETFYRLSEMARSLIVPEKKNEVGKFYLTPNFEIVAPIGTPAQLLFKLGELCEFSNCDRANTYKLTVQSIEKAKEKGWRRDEVLQFFTRYSQLGIPENVNFTLGKWLGKDPSATFHNVLMLTIQRHQVQMFESNSAFKPFIVHRFIPGMYAVHPDKKEELESEMVKAGILFGDNIIDYPQDQDIHQDKERLSQQVEEARQLKQTLQELAAPTSVQPYELCHISEAKNREDVQQVRTTGSHCKRICTEAIESNQHIRLEYPQKSGDPVWMTVIPENVSISPNGNAILVGRVLESNRKLSFSLSKVLNIESIASE